MGDGEGEGAGGGASSLWGFGSRARENFLKYRCAYVEFRVFQHTFQQLDNLVSCVLNLQFHVHRIVIQ
jgi:hypothetical protein